MQPYFYHFLLGAVYKADLFEKYGLMLIRKYESLLRKCEKGLSEAWENMDCDYSHAWGAAPLYYLKKALSGFEILEAGYKKITFFLRNRENNKKLIKTITPDMCKEELVEDIFENDGYHEELKDEEFTPSKEWMCLISQI